MKPTPAPQPPSLQPTPAARGVAKPEPAPAPAAATPQPAPAVKKEAAPSPGAPAATKLAPGEKVNINTAPKEGLDKLPGIGPVKSQAIIHGRPFAKIEDIMKVKGIKEAEFGKIKDLITVKYWRISLFQGLNLIAPQSRGWRPQCNAFLALVVVSLVFMPVLVLPPRSKRIR